MRPNATNSKSRNTVGVEVDYGQFTVKDGQHDSHTRVQVAVRYKLVK